MKETTFRSAWAAALVIVVIVILIICIIAHKPKSTRPPAVTEHVPVKESISIEASTPHSDFSEQPHYDIENLKRIMQQRDPFKRRR